MADQLVQRGVAYGLKITAQGTPDTTVAMAAGGAIFDNQPGSVAAVSSFDLLTGNPADPSLPRWDILGLDSSLTLTQIVGTPTAPDEFGFVPYPDASAYAQLAAVYVDAGATVVTADDIQDLRGGDKPRQDDFILQHVSPYRIPGQFYGVSDGSQINTWTNNDLFLVPYWNGRAFPIDGLMLGVHGVTITAGAVARLGLYQDDGAGFLTNVVDAGTVAIDVAGQPIASFSTVVMQPGWIWRACALQSLGANKPALREWSLVKAGGQSPIGAASAVLADGCAYGGIKVSGISGALPATVGPSGSGAAATADYTATFFPEVWMRAA